MNARFEFMLPGDLGKKRLVAHVTLVEGNSRIQRLAVASRKVVQHDQLFSAREQVINHEHVPKRFSLPLVRNGG